MVITLVAINVAVFFVSGFGKASVITRYGDRPGPDPLSPVLPVLHSMFFHLDVPHILFNMVALLIVGPAVEVLVGRVRFIALYLLAGLGGGVAYYLIARRRSRGRGVRRHLRHHGRLRGAGLRADCPAPVVALIVINLVIGFTGNIGWQAHIGGLVTGAALALVFHRHAICGRRLARSP